MTTATSEAIAELDELIRTETVRSRHIALVQLRSRLLAALDNVITPESDHAP